MGKATTSDDDVDDDAMMFFGEWISSKQVSHNATIDKNKTLCTVCTECLVPYTRFKCLLLVS